MRPPALPRRTPFNVLLQDCLQMKEEEELLAVFDEFAYELIPDLVSAINDANLHATFLFMPRAYQLRLLERKRGGSGNVRLPRRFTDAFADARTILCLLNGDLATSSVRGAVLDIERKSDCRMAHIPGFTRSMLEVLPDSPLRHIQRTGELVAWALGEASEAELVTTGHDGTEYVLHLQLDGWRCGPFLSSGVIAQGSWGNVPPGESFCCPESYEKIHGEICINGSVPGLPLTPEDEIVLRFEDGKLVQHWPAASPATEFLLREEAAAAKGKDENWNTFAELGIGLNPAVRELTGNSLVDEKALGTIHVAIGGNRVFGGPLSAKIHADLVTWGATLRLDGHEVISNGRLNLRTMARWRRNLRIAPLETPPDAWVRIDEAKWEVGTGQLRLKRNNRLDYINMADRKTWKRFEPVWGLLPREMDSFPLHNFFARMATPALRDTAREMLGVLHHYDVLQVQR